MPFYKNWGFALVVIWFVTFFVNWAVHGGDPFSLIFLELAATFAWLLAWAGWSIFVRRRRPGKAKVGESGQMPVHLWIVGGLAGIWYSMGAVAYVARQTGGDVIVGDPYAAPLVSYPAWVDAAWALGIWAGLAASLLLPARSRYALPAFGVSVAGLLVTAVYVRAVWPTYNAQNLVAIQAAVVALLLFVYAWRMRRRKVLR